MICQTLLLYLKKSEMYNVNTNMISYMIFDFTKAIKNIYTIKRRLILLSKTRAKRFKIQASIFLH